jgi:hypothetical protein
MAIGIDIAHQNLQKIVVVFVIVINQIRFEFYEIELAVVLSTITLASTDTFLLYTNTLTSTISSLLFYLIEPAVLFQSRLQLAIYACRLLILEGHLARSGRCFAQPDQNI